MIDQVALGVSQGEEIEHRNGQPTLMFDAGRAGGGRGEFGIHVQGDAPIGQGGHQTQGGAAEGGGPLHQDVVEAVLGQLLAGDDVLGGGEDKPGWHQHLVGVQLKPRNVRESPASFRRYLDLEGAPEARQRYERAGLLGTGDGDSITRRYAKYAKTVVEVGRGARAFHRPLNHPLEFLPLSDPSTLRVGDTLRVRLLLLGKPAPLARLHTGSVAVSASTLRDTTAARLAAREDVSLETDSMGVATVVITRPGLWNVRTLQIIPAIKGSGADWDVHWATLVFSVRPRA